MATERQIAANRANAKRSSGPKSRAGKARASQNAYRHGLAACMTMDADRVSAVAALAREIQASMRGQIDRAGALAIAQAELEVSRVHKLASELFAKKPNGFAKHRPATGSQGTAVLAFGKSQAQHCLRMHPFAPAVLAANRGEGALAACACFEVEQRSDNK